MTNPSQYDILTNMHTNTKLNLNMQAYELNNDLIFVSFVSNTGNSFYTKKVILLDHNEAKELIRLLFNILSEAEAEDDTTRNS